MDAKFGTFRGIPYLKMKEYENNARDVDYPLNDDLKTAHFKKVFSNFERREPQYRFMDAVWQSLDEKTEIAAEVPTGIGKTIAYLLPAAVSLNSGKPVIISTYTNYLADKIVDEELLKLRTILGVELKARLKGKEQYISLGKFEELLISKSMMKRSSLCKYLSG